MPEENKSKAPTKEEKAGYQPKKVSSIPDPDESKGYQPMKKPQGAKVPPSGGSNVMPPKDQGKKD